MSRNEDTRRDGLAGPAPEERQRPVGRRNGEGTRVDPEVEADHEPRRSIISAYVADEPGVLETV